MLFYYIFTECVIPDVLNNRTHVKRTKGRVLLYPEINPPCYISINGVNYILHATIQTPTCFRSTTKNTTFTHV